MAFVDLAELVPAKEGSKMGDGGAFISFLREGEIELGDGTADSGREWGIISS